MADCKLTLFNSDEGSYAGCLTHNGCGRFLDTDECWISAGTTRPDEVAAERARLKLVREDTSRESAKWDAIRFWHNTHPDGRWQNLSRADQEDWLTSLEVFVQEWDRRDTADPKPSAELVAEAHIEGERYLSRRRTEFLESIRTERD